MQVVSPASGLYTNLGDLAQAAAAFVEQRHTRLTIWEFSLADLPENWNYLVYAGLGSLFEHLQSFCFAPEQLEFLRYHPAFASVPLGWFEHLAALRFMGEVWSMPEGAICFPGTPLVRITAPFDVAALVGHQLLGTLLQQIRVASQVSRIVNAAAGRLLIDNSSSVGNSGKDAAITAIRAAYLAGILSTTHGEASRLLQIPGQVNLPDNWLRCFPDDGEALRRFGTCFSTACVPPISSFSVEAGLRTALASRIPLHAIYITGNEWNHASQNARRLLDLHGRKHVKIIAEAPPDELALVRNLEAGAKVDGFLLDSQALTRASHSLQGVYKIVAYQDDQLRWHAARRTDQLGYEYPGVKQVYRQVDDDGSLAGDLIARENEPSSDEPMLRCMVQQGRLAARLPGLEEARDYCTMQRIRLPIELHSLTVAKQMYPIRYSEALEAERTRLTAQRRS